MISRRACVSYRHIALSVMIWCYACANIITPQGGQKDTTPPQLIEKSTTPANRSTNFNTDRIELVFNEYPKLANIAQILVSPPMKEKPEYKVRKKSVIVVLKDSLRDSTTYTINFGESISDITENNALKNFQYVFSTGSYVDSLKANTRVKNAGKGRPHF